MRIASVTVAVVLCALTGSACFSYHVVSPDEVSPGQDIRLRLTVEEAAKYQDLRLADPRLLEGQLMSAGGFEILVRASIGTGDPTRGTRVLVQDVSVSRSGILEVELREMDRTKTGLLVGGGGAVIVAAILRSGRGSGRRSGPGDEVPEARRIPLLRFSLPFGSR